MLVRATLAVALFAYANQTQAAEADAANLCRGDAFRLCSGYIPDRERITACMLRRKAELSPGCRMVFDESNRTPVAAATGR